MMKLAIIFFLLGNLSEYQGRAIIENDSRVESFYADERVAAKIFNDKAIELININKIKEPLKVRVASGGHIEFENREVTTLLNSYYPISGPDIYSDTTQGYDRKWHQTIWSVLPEKTVMQASKEEKYAYLLGSYVRYGKDKCINFANNLSKAKISEKLLTELGYEDVTLKETCKGCVPSSFELCFSPKSANDSLLSDASNLIKQAKDQLNQQPFWGK